MDNSSDNANTPIRTIPYPDLNVDEHHPLLAREWLVTNGLGGYASGRVSGLITRRYHGLLVGAFSAPLGRMVMLNHIGERVYRPDGGITDISSVDDNPEFCTKPDECYLAQFRLEMGLPVWLYRMGDVDLEKRVFLSHHQNTVRITYRVIKGTKPLRLELRPAVHFRSHEAPVTDSLELPYALTILGDRYELSHKPDQPTLRFYLDGRETAFTVEGKKIEAILYRIEESRGYSATGDLWSPGLFSVLLRNNAPVTFVASAEPWETILALTPGEAIEAEIQRRRLMLVPCMPQVRSGIGNELLYAADQFIIKPAGRLQDEVRAHASGDEVRTIIAGYHWFTDWGRDTMISLEGLTLVTGRHLEAGWILRSFLRYVQDGLVPNLFPEGGSQALYHTADASLWYFHAFDRYLAYTDDRRTLSLALPRLLSIVQSHLKGTRFGIHVDPEDGLLSQGQEGYQLTWMDAKVDDWVVTPRRGKAVEINALWYNALRLLETWMTEERGPSEAQFLTDLADRCHTSFNKRFWFPEGGYLYDVVDGEHGNDSSCRPNQVFSISLHHPVLDNVYWKPVMDVVQQRLLTPVGLRSLAPDDPNYKARYYGDIRSRDAAYHQGTVWVWLIGPYIDAWLKLHPGDTAHVRNIIDNLTPHLSDKGVGSISEIFDGDQPFHPHGCISQAWSVAEVLRAWVKMQE